VKSVTSGGYGTPPKFSTFAQLSPCWHLADTLLSRTKRHWSIHMQEEVRTKYHPSSLSTIRQTNLPARNLNIALLFLDVAQADFSTNSGYWCDIEIVKHLLIQTRDQIKAEYDKVAKLV
jgi:hypothetical protein